MSILSVHWKYTGSKLSGKWGGGGGGGGLDCESDLAVCGGMCVGGGMCDVYGGGGGGVYGWGWGVYVCLCVYVGGGDVCA